MKKSTTMTHKEEMMMEEAIASAELAGANEMDNILNRTGGGQANFSPSDESNEEIIGSAGGNGGNSPV